MLAENIKTLSTPEKIRLIQELWNDILIEVEERVLTEDQEAMLDLRYKAFLENPNEGTPWREVKKDLKELL